MLVGLGCVMGVCGALCHIIWDAAGNAFERGVSGSGTDPSFGVAGKGNVRYSRTLPGYGLGMNPAG